MELIVADPTPASQEALKNSFQSIFTKHSPDSELCQQDMCHRLLKSIDNNKRNVRFLMKQFMEHSKHVAQQNGSIKRAYNALKKRYVQLKQSSNSQNLQADQTIADLQHRLQALQSTVDEKESQLRKFRDIYARDGMARIPSSSHSTGSNSRGGGSRGSSEAHRQHQLQPPSNTPPLQAYILQKKVREREKEHALGHVTRRNIHGPEVDSVITPIQPPSPRHYVRPSIDSASPAGVPRNSGGYVFPSQRKHSRSSSQPQFVQQRSNPYRQQPPSSNYSRSQAGSSGYKFSSHRR